MSFTWLWKSNEKFNPRRQMVVDVLHPGKATVSKADVSSSILYCQFLVVLFLLQKKWSRIFTDKCPWHQWMICCNLNLYCTNQVLLNFQRWGRSWLRCTPAQPTVASHLASRPSLVAESPLASPSSTTPWTSPRSSSPNTGMCPFIWVMAVPPNHPSSPRLLRQGVIEAKTRGSRKQRKEKKNRTKKVEITMIKTKLSSKYVQFNLDLVRDYILPKLFRCAVSPRPRWAKLERRWATLLC